MGQLEFMMVNLLFGEHTGATEEVKAPGTANSHQDICTPAHTFTQSECVMTLKPNLDQHEATCIKCCLPSKIFLSNEGV